METIDLPPGVVQVASRKAKTGSWRETHLVRWEGNTMLPVAGWEEINYTAFASRLRVMHKWVDNNGQIHIAYFCEEHVYVDAGDGNLTDITPTGGIVGPDPSGQGGFGDGTFGDGLFGTPRDSISRDVVATPCWTLDNWGEELRAMSSVDGRLLGWSPSAPATLLEAVANAPSGRTFVVTPERHIMIFGAGGDASRFEWSDEEDDTEWTPGILTKAGGYNVEPRSPIITARVTTAGILFHTARMAYLVRHIGNPYIYTQGEKMGDCPPPVSSQSIITIPEGMMWLAINGFWVFNGVGVYPAPCSIWEWIREDVSFDLSKYYASAIPNPSKFEVWFAFVSSEAVFNDRVAIYNYGQKIWYMANISRICGVAFQSDTNPFMSDGDFVYRHETGYEYEGYDLPWAESHTLNAVNGSLKSTIKQMLPEIDGDKDAVQFIFYKSNNPADQSAETASDPKLIRDNGYVDVRETARDFRMRVEMINPSAWSLGITQMDVKARGQK